MNFHTKNRTFFQKSSFLNLFIVFFLFLGFFPIFKIYWTRYWEITTMNGAYSHAPVALLVFFFLLWRKRNLFSHKDEGGSAPLWGYILLLCGVILKIYGEVHDFSVLRGMTLIPILFGILLIKFPQDTVRGLFYPILFLLFIIPLPTFVIDQITLPLQDATASLVTSTMTLMDYQIDRAGHILMIKGVGSPTGYHEFFINQTCSGIRFMVALFGLGTLYVYLRGLRFWQGFFMIAMIVPLSILGNFFRVLSTVLMFFYISPKMAEDFLHEFSGVLIFCFTLGCLFLIEKLTHRWR